MEEWIPEQNNLFYMKWTQIQAFHSIREEFKDQFDFFKVKK